MLNWYNLAKNKRDMLDGCINRMFVSDDISEVENMKKYALCYIDEIYKVIKEKKYNL